MRDPLLRTAGRVRVAPEDQPAIPGGSKAGYAYQPHTHGKDLVGWRIKATFPTGPKNELRWHDGFVVLYGEIQDDEGGAGTVHQYSLFFPIDAAGCECTTPFNGKDLCFRKPHLSDPQASEREMTRARAALGEAAE